MKKHVLSLVALAFGASFLTAACSSEPEPQDPSMVPTAYPPATYTAPPPAATPAPAAASPLALPCQSDGGICGTHKCNLTTQKCSFPCAGIQDCMAGMNCMAGICLPGAPQ